jgi:hypothetical protein
MISKTAAGCIAALLLAGTLPARAVDGAILINQTRALAGNVTAGDTPGFPVSINTPGYFVLTSNLTVPDANTTAIQINADNVTIDLNGFAILGPTVCPTDGFTVAGPCAPTGTGWGIDDYSSVVNGRLNTRVINGTVNGMGAYGMVLGRNSRVTGVNITSNGADGIYSLGGVVSDVLMRGNGGNGVTTSSVVMTNSRALFNRGVGVYASSPSLVTDCVLYTNGAVGLLTVSGTRYTNNLFESNNGGNANPQVSSGTQAGTNTCGGAACP